MNYCLLMPFKAYAKPYIKLSWKHKILIILLLHDLINFTGFQSCFDARFGSDLHCWVFWCYTGSFLMIMEPWPQIRSQKTATTNSRNTVATKVYIHIYMYVWQCVFAVCYKTNIFSVHTKFWGCWGSSFSFSTDKLSVLTYSFLLL